MAETDAVDTLTGGEEPKLCWEVVYEYTRTLEIEAQIEYVDDDTLAYGTTKEISPGKNGVEEQTIHAVQDQNGNWEESVVSSRVVEPAENQVIARGTGPVSPMLVNRSFWDRQKFPSVENYRDFRLFRRLLEQSAYGP